jgi:hypothetical protein
MSQENVEFAKQGIAAAQEAYANDDIEPSRQQVEKILIPRLCSKQAT